MGWFERLPESLPGDGITVPSLPNEEEKESNVIRVEFRKRPNPTTARFLQDLVTEAEEGNIRGVTCIAERHDGSVQIVLTNGKLKVSDWLSAVILAVGQRLQDFWLE
jgi:hypothetical protein